MSEINIDQSMIQKDVSLNHKEEKLVEMSNWLYMLYFERGFINRSCQISQI